MVNGLDPSGITRGDTETEQDFIEQLAGVTEVTEVTVVPPWKKKTHDVSYSSVTQVESSIDVVHSSSEVL